MQITILQNSDESLYKSIREGLQWAENLFLGVSYGSYGAFDLLNEYFINFLRSNGKLRALFDIEEFITEKKLIEELATIPGDSECKVFIRSGSGKSTLGLYHPKFYLFYDNENYRIIIGSSNFTLGGIKRNIECNLSIYGERDELFASFLSFFNELWTAESAINISNHGDLLDLYQSAFQQSIKSDETKVRRLQGLREKLTTEAAHKIQLKKVILNEEFAYLLGLLCANSKIDFEKRELTIYLQRGIANRGKSDEGFYYSPDISDYKISQYDEHKKDVERIIESLSLLIKNLGTKDEISMNHVGDFHFQIHIKFDKNSIIFEELEKSREFPERGKVIPFVPKSVLKSKSRNIVMSYLKGYCDLKSRITVSDGIYDTQKKIYGLLRMGISLPHDATEFIEKFLVLLNRIGIEKGVSATDPSRRTRENLIRIDVRSVPYELLGTHWRRIFLKDFVSYMKSRNAE